eukprot:s31_g29.t1
MGKAGKEFGCLSKAAPSLPLCFASLIAPKDFCEAPFKTFTIATCGLTASGRMPRDTAGKAGNGGSRSCQVPGPDQ